MKRRNWLLIAKHKLRKEIPTLCVFLCCLPLTTLFGCGAISVVKAPFPEEFALMRSFFQDTAALEEWIRLPPKQE